MTRPRIGALVIGQSPRPDLFDELSRVLGDRFELTMLGAGGSRGRCGADVVRSRGVEENCPTWMWKNGTISINNMNAQCRTSRSASAGSTPEICATSATERPAST
ncbi:MAG: AroM family protein [Geminicoccaceae bacterium]